MSQRKESIVIFPFMAQGHIIPFLALALKVEQRGFQVTFVSTPLNIKKLKTTSVLPLNSSISLREIPFNSSDHHGLPPNSENTDVLPLTQIISLLQASLSLKPHFKKLLQDLIAAEQGVPVLCVVADIFFGWTAEVANELGIYHAVFSGAGGFGLACYYSIWLNLPHRESDSPEFHLPDFEEARKIHMTQLTPSVLAADGKDMWSVFQRRNFSGWADSNAILFNTVEEIDSIGLQYFRRKIGRPVWSVGPMLSPVDKQRDPEDYYMNWLNMKKPYSVVYVSFGSQSAISASQMMEMAKALEASQKNFIWVVRPPLGFDSKEEFRAEQWLPENFMKRVVEEEGRGLIVEKWAPQMEILGHKSVGMFFTHCGWNSVLESLWAGVPLLGWPMAAEQFYNAKYLEEEVRVCLEVARGINFEIRSEDLADQIESVMGESERGARMREKACEIRDVIKGALRDANDEEGLKGSSVQGMDAFLNAALLMKEKNAKSG